MKVALAQINATVGDLAGNARKIVDARAARLRARRAPGAHARTRPVRLSARRPAAAPRVHAGLRGGAARTARASWPICRGCIVVVGHPHQFGDKGDVRSKSVRCRSASMRPRCWQGGAVVATYCKRELPNYQVFDERRYFASGRDCGPGRGRVRGRRPAVRPADLRRRLVRRAGARGARPPAPRCCACSTPRRSTSARWPSARSAWRERARDVGLPLLYAHLVGGQDEVVFDGASFALDAAGRGRRAGADVRGGAGDRRGRRPTAARRRSSPSPAHRGAGLGGAGRRRARLHRQERLPRRDHRPVAAASTRRWCWRSRSMRWAPTGCARVMMPSPYTADISWIDARDMARAPGRALRRDLDRADVRGLPAQPGGRVRRAAAEDATEENIQARIRGTLLMALSNKFGSIVLTTGNKSEMATGYCTLYGDMAGGFAVIKDVAKTLVYRLAHWKNAQGREVIPERIITRAAVGRAAPRPDRPGQPAALRGAGRASCSATWKTTRASTRSSPRASRGRCRARDAADQDQRVQAAPGAGGHPHHPPRASARTGAIRSPRSSALEGSAARRSLGHRIFAEPAMKQITADRQTVQARRSARGAGRGRA